MKDEPRVGHWNPIHVSNIGESIFSCSECGKSVGIYISLGQRLDDHCPSCNARMVEELKTKEEILIDLGLEYLMD